MPRISAGDRVTVSFPGSGDVDAVVLEVRGDEALVQQEGTSRSEWASLSQIR